MNELDKSHAVVIFFHGKEMIVSRWFAEQQGFKILRDVEEVKAESSDE